MQFTDETLYAGADWEFTESIPEYPASDGWALTIAIRHSTDPSADLVGTPNGDDFDFSIPAATTADYSMRDYKYQAIFTKAASTRIYENGEVEIFPLLNAVGDNRTHNEIMLDAITATLEERATREQKSMKFADREIEYLSFDELITAQKYYNKKVEQDNRLASGKKAIPRILESY